MNKLIAAIRKRLGAHFYLMLRPDPGGTNGFNICMVYPPEINTH